MRSATSLFNSTLYCKTMTRFWPLWTLYGLIWLFAIPLNLLNGYFNNIRWGVTDAQSLLLRRAEALPSLLQAGVALSVVFGVLCAMAVFSYLYNSRSACMIHALPMRRETLFTTSYLAGFSFLLLPHLAVALITAVAELALLPSEGWGAALSSLGIWLLVQSGVALFFFSFAVFCAMFTGHILALPVFYGILNALVFVIYALITGLMSEFFYGYSASHPSNTALVKYCTPAAHLFVACEWDAVPTIAENAAATTEQWCLRSPAIVAGYAAAGLVFAILALMVYRRRHVESAGDVVAIAFVRPVFKCGVSFCSGLCLGTFTSLFFGWTATELSLSLSAIFWAVVGYFIAEMLLKKSFRVLKAWKGATVMAVVMAALCLTCFLDAFGVESRVPDLDRVTSLTVSSSLGSGSYYTNWGEITDPEQIQEFIDLHQAIIAEKDRADYGESEPGDRYIFFDLTYNLKDGSALTRRYYSIPVFTDEVDLEGTVTWAANRIIQNRALMEQGYQFDSYEQGRLVEAYLTEVYSQTSGYVGLLYLDGSAQQLWEAMRQDFDEGTIGVQSLFDNNEDQEPYATELCFNWEVQSSTGAYTKTCTIPLTPNASHTLAVLEELGILKTENSDYLQTQDILDEHFYEVTLESAEEIAIQPA